MIDQSAAAGRFHLFHRPNAVIPIAAVGLLLICVAQGRASDPVVALRERYLGPTGLPAESAYALSNGILPAPNTESFKWEAIFRIAYRTADIARLQEAQPVYADCYFVRQRNFSAPSRARPVWDGRVYGAGDRLVVAAYTSAGERVFGHVDEHARVVQSEKSIAIPGLDQVHYNPFSGQLWRRAPGGEIKEQLLFHAPHNFVDRDGKAVYPPLRIVQLPINRFALVADGGGSALTLATCTLDGNNAERSDGHSPTVAPGCTLVTGESTTVFEVRGNIAVDVVDTRHSLLTLRRNVPHSIPASPAIRIDGSFDEWRSVPGIADPQGDIVSYLQYNPDTDLLQFKVANDDQHLYFYTRVAGRHGNTAAGRDRYYFYVYIDADRNPKTGYLPTRDDDCYYGVTLGDDCEAQYEFIGGRFVKTFFGFAGHSTENDVLSGRVTLGPSWYNRHDEQGRVRNGYKVEYVRRAGKISITKDFSEGTSDDIQIALSPDGSECEMRAALSGFLKTASGRPVIAAGQRIDLAAGVEASGQARGNSKWGADSSAIIRGYRIAP